MGFIEWFAGIWGVKSEKPWEVDVIVPLSYGVLPGDRLANGTEMAMNIAIALHKEYPEAIIAFGNAPNCFQGSELVEGTLKEEFLRRAEIPEKFIIETDPVSNSVTEAYAVKKSLKKVGPHRRWCILVIAGKFHSRSARLIWEKVFPESRIAMHIFDCRFEYQADHPESLVRGCFRYITLSIARYLVVKIFGLRMTGRLTSLRSLPFKFKIS